MVKQQLSVVITINKTPITTARFPTFNSAVSMDDTRADSSASPKPSKHIPRIYQRTKYQYFVII